MASQLDSQPGAAQSSPRTSQPKKSGDGSIVYGVRNALSFSRISAAYIGIVMFIIFAFTIPETFLAWTTWKTLIDSQAIVGIAAIALVLPSAAGSFNLAIGAQVGFGSILVASLLIDQGWPLAVAITVTLLAGCLTGLVSGWLTERVGIESIIATMGVSSLLLASITAVSDGQQILGMPDDLVSITSGEVLGLSNSVIIMLIVAVIVWYLLERTPVGRHIYATGGNKDAARLAGVNTGLIVTGAFALGGVFAAVAGVLITSRLGNADPTIGPGYLLPAFTAAFLGSTQVKPGRFNVGGTLLAVLVLAVGIKGLQLSGAPVWIPDAFNGAILLVSVGLASMKLKNRNLRGIRGGLPWSRKPANTEHQGN